MLVLLCLFFFSNTSLESAKVQLLYPPLQVFFFFFFQTSEYFMETLAQEDTYNALHKDHNCLYTLTVMRFLIFGERLFMCVCGLQGCRCVCHCFVLFLPRLPS